MSGLVYPPERRTSGLYSAAEDATPPSELLELRNYRAERVDRVRESAREQPNRVRITLDLEPLDAAAVTIQSGDDTFELSARDGDVIFRHESSSQVAGPAVASPDLPATILAGTPDTVPPCGDGASVEGPGTTTGPSTPATTPSPHCALHDVAVANCDPCMKASRDFNRWLDDESWIGTVRRIVRQEITKALRR